MNADILTSAVKEAALELGFDLAGICKPTPPPNYDVYSRWVEEGRHAGMSYLARDSARSARADPLRILPECQSILVVAKRYLPEELHILQRKNLYIAAYAGGQDYHLLIKNQLEKLAQNIKTTAGIDFKYRTYTDTGPILEKAYAQMAGLGWIGRNGCLINPDLGSYLFLGEILLALPLVPDEPFGKDLCGTCSACIEACPASCILPNRTIDSEQCISYLTIEHRGVILPEKHKTIGSWLFGCDDCQSVCPWNRRFARPTEEPAFQARDEYRTLDLVNLLSMDKEIFLKVFRNSPLLRSRHEGIVRNAMVVAGNHPDERLIPILGNHLLHNQSSLLRCHAAWSLGHYPHDLVKPLLLEAQKLETDEAVCQAIYTALNSG